MNFTGVSKVLNQMGLLMGNAAVQVSVCKVCQVIYPRAGTGGSGGLLCGRYALFKLLSC